MLSVAATPGLITVQRRCRSARLIGAGPTASQRYDSIADPVAQLPAVLAKSAVREFAVALQVAEQYLRLRVSTKREFGSQVALLYETGAKSFKFGLADRSCLFQPIELFDFICSAETHRASELIARLLSLLHIALGHASSLKDQIYKHAEVRKHYPGYHPDRLDPT
jgi:hypothetical protein